MFARRQHGFTRLERRFARVQVAQCSTFGSDFALERLDSGFEGRFEGVEVKLRVESPVRRDAAGGVGLALHVEDLALDCPIARVGLALALARRVVELVGPSEKHLASLGVLLDLACRPFDARVDLARG